MEIRYLKKTLLLVNILLTGIIFYLGATIFLEWKSAKRADQSRDQPLTKKSGFNRKEVGRPVQLGAYQVIVRRDIFSTTPSPQQVEDGQPSQEEIITPTRLDLRLKGTILGNGQSFAVIAEGPVNEEGIYTLNDSLQNARIVEILPDQVILNVNGRKEALILFSEQEGAAGQAGVPATQAYPRSRPADTRRSPAGVRPPVKVPGRR